MKKYGPKGPGNKCKVMRRALQLRQQIKLINDSLDSYGEFRQWRKVYYGRTIAKYYIARGFDISASLCNNFICFNWE